MSTMLDRRGPFVLTVLVVLAVLGLLTGILYLLKPDGPDTSRHLFPPNPTEPLEPSSSQMEEFGHAAVTVDAPFCAKIGREIFIKQGNVADVAVATLLCVGVIHPESSGLGGGFVLVHYSATTKESIVLNARDVAPLKATPNMFHGNATISSKGGLSVAVPGELKGLWELYLTKGSGRVGWTDLIQPSIELCENGFPIDEQMARALERERDNILKEPSMAEIFVNPDTGNVWQVNDTFRRPQLAETLKIVASEGGNALYNSSIHDLATWFVDDLQELGGIIEEADMLNYEVTWTVPINASVPGNFTLLTVPPPASGIFLGFIWRILSSYKLTRPSVDDLDGTVETLHLITEAFKWAFAQRTKMGDPWDPQEGPIVEELMHDLLVSPTFLNLVHERIVKDSTSQSPDYYGARTMAPFDHGTSHVSIVGPNGDAISVTSTINLVFGAGIRSNRTGIIYNDNMDAFSAIDISDAYGMPPSPNNLIAPGKRPVSSMTPSIYIDQQGRVRLVLGTAGGPRMIPSNSYVAIRNLIYNETIKEAIDAPRLHHQIYPMILEYEYGTLEQWVVGLEGKGHITNRTTIGATCGIARSEAGSLFAMVDFRKPGSLDGL